MHAPFISIIIPTYNCSNTIQACLESIIYQSFTDYEILIMDGQSTDDTLSICKPFESNHPIQTYREKDHGIYDAMNKGIEKAAGQWIYFLGADDRLYNNAVLETFALAAKNCAFQMYYGNVLVNGDTAWAKDQEIYDGYFDINKLLTKNICHQAILYNKSVFQKLGNFNLSYVVCADFDLNLRIASKYPIKHLDFITAIFNPGGASSSLKDHAFMDDLSANIIRYFHWRLYKKSFKKHERQIIWQAWNGNYSLSDKLYLLAVGYYLKIQRKLGFN